MTKTEARLAKARKFVLLERNRGMYRMPEVAVCWRNKDKWAVVLDGMDVINESLVATHEPSPSNRSDEFKSVTRFSLDEAWRLAEKVIAFFKKDVEKESKEELDRWADDGGV